MKKAIIILLLLTMTGCINVYIHRETEVIISDCNVHTNIDAQMTKEEIPDETNKMK